MQRTCQVRLFCDPLAAFTFWGWNAVIVLAAITLPLGYTSGKEYAELEWPIDMLITVVWVSYADRVLRHDLQAQDAAHLRRQLVLRRVHPDGRASCTSSTAPRCPVSFWPMKSYSAYAGVQDAMVQWWYGHNAVGFFLTAGFLGMMYYFVPKQAGRPIYSYRLSVVHFWALIFTYMWAGPHHLHYTALPDWTQSLGMVFSLILLAPSWGGMINGMMTLVGRVAQIARRPDPQVPHRVAVVLRHVDLRGADDVDQDGQCAVALHRLDRRPRAFGRARLGRVHLDRLDVLPDPAHVRQDRDVVACG